MAGALGYGKRLDGSERVCDSQIERDSESECKCECE